MYRDETRAVWLRQARRQPTTAQDRTAALVVTVFRTCAALSLMALLVIAVR